MIAGPDYCLCVKDFEAVLDIERFIYKSRRRYICQISGQVKR